MNVIDITMVITTMVVTYEKITDPISDFDPNGHQSVAESSVVDDRRHGFKLIESECRFGIPFAPGCTDAYQNVERTFFDAIHWRFQNVSIC